jgi:hypothetical protein
MSGSLSPTSPSKVTRDPFCVCFSSSFLYLPCHYFIIIASTTMTSHNLPHETDYIVIGGGTSGLVVACRLSENPSIRITVLEAGPDCRQDPRIQTPDAWDTLSDSELNWKMSFIPQVCNQIPCTRNKLEVKYIDISDWPSRSRSRSPNWESTWGLIGNQWTSICASISSGYRCLGKAWK